MDLLKLLEWHQFKGLPKSVDELLARTILNVSTCKLRERITELPESLGQLVVLKALDLNYCFALAKVPESLGQLAALQRLHVEQCSAMTSLPESLGGLTALTLLTLRNCFNLKSLPEFMGKLTTIRLITAGNCNALTSLPASLGHLTSLQCLDVSFCSALTDLPESLGLLTGLTYLKIEGCNAIPTLSPHMPNEQLFGRYYSRSIISVLQARNSKSKVFLLIAAAHRQQCGHFPSELWAFVCGRFELASLQ